jgi:hypothetical protein
MRIRVHTVEVEVFVLVMVSCNLRRHVQSVQIQSRITAKANQARNSVFIVTTNRKKG